MGKQRIAILLFGTLLFAGSAPRTAADEYYDARTSLFEMLPVGTNDIVFLGNSITDFGEWQELLGMDNVKNRGIRSDTMRGVEKRLGQVLRGHPKQIFLLIGINDVASGLSAEELGRRYASLVEKIMAGSPGTQLILQSVMPVNNDFRRYKGLIGKQGMIPEFNKKISALAEKYGLIYVDLWDALADETTGKLKKEFTTDGLHLNGPGYKAWVDMIAPYVDGK